jgi:hypothetical protein
VREFVKIKTGSCKECEENKGDAVWSAGIVREEMRNQRIQILVAHAYH